MCVFVCTHLTGSWDEGLLPPQCPLLPELVEKPCCKMDRIKVLSLDSGIRKTSVLISTLVCSKLLQLCPTLCDPMDHIPPGSSVHGIFQASILEQVAISYSRGSSWPRDQTHISFISCIGRRTFYHWAILESQLLLTSRTTNFFKKSFYVTILWRGLLGVSR